MSPHPDRPADDVAPTQRVEAAGVSLAVPADWEVQRPEGTDPALILLMPDDDAGRGSILVRRGPAPHGAAYAVDQGVEELLAAEDRQVRLIGDCLVDADAVPGLAGARGAVRMQRLVSAVTGVVLVQDRYFAARDGELVEITVTVPQALTAVVGQQAQQVAESALIDGVPMAEFTDADRMDPRWAEPGAASDAAEPAATRLVEPLTVTAGPDLEPPITEAELSRLQDAGGTGVVPRRFSLGGDPELESLRAKGYVTTGRKLSEEASDFAARCAAAAGYLRVNRRTTEGTAWLHCWIGSDGFSAVASVHPGSEELTLCTHATLGLPTAIVAWLGTVPAGQVPAGVPESLDEAELDTLTRDLRLGGAPTEIVDFDLIDVGPMATLIRVGPGYLAMAASAEQEGRASLQPIPSASVLDLAGVVVHRAML